MGDAYERALKKQEPYWLRGSPIAAVARLHDLEDTVLKDGVAARLPAFAPEDAAFHVGDTRQLERAPGETVAAFLARCERAHDIWYWAGTKRGLQEVFEPWGISSRVTVFNDFETSYGEDPSSAWWSRVWILVDSASGPWSADGVWDDPGTWDDGGVWDCTITLAELAYIRRDVRRKKNAHAYPAMMFIILDDREGVWDGPGVYDDGGVWDAATIDPPVIPIVLGHTWEEEEQWFEGAPGQWDEPDDIWDDFE